MINIELKRLAHLLNDIKSQGCNTSEIATDFDVVLSLCDLVTLTRNQIAKTIRLEVDASQAFIVHLPENTLQQALLNLLINAGEALTGNKFGHICIKVFEAKSGLVIQVVDNGPGFSQAFLDSGIPPCQPSEANTGLIMTQRFIKNMGGSIRLGNHFPHGACISILLPKKCITGDNLA